MRLFVFGDSIAFGARDPEGGWGERLKKYLYEKSLTDSKYEGIIYNVSVSGNNSSDLIGRFEFEIKQRLKEENGGNIIIFAIGTNDSRYLNEKENLQITPEQFKENIEKLLEMSKKFSSKIIFVSITSFDESKTMPLPWDTKKYYTNELAKRNNEIIKSVCGENKIIFIDLFEEWTKDYKKFLDEDGLHPNSEGHQKIFERVKEILKEHYLK